MAGSTRMIVASTQMALGSIIKNSLQTMPNFESFLSVSRMVEVETKLMRSAYNILLLDIDTVTADSITLNRLCDHYKLLVILTAGNSMRAVGLMKGQVHDFILKPALFNDFTTSNYVNTIYKRIDGFRNVSVAPVNYKDISKLATFSNKVIAIASSTGGTEALEKILTELPADIPPIVAVQHMPSGFTKLFADRLNAKYPMEVKEAQTGDFLMQGRFLLAPADQHMRLARKQGKLAVECFIGTRIHGVMPAADVLFESVAELVRDKAIGVILTGMGADGAKGLMMMQKNGAKTIGQDKETCVVYGMPKVAKDLGAVQYELPIDKIAQKILSFV